MSIEFVNLKIENKNLYTHIKNIGTEINTKRIFSNNLINEFHDNEIFYKLNSEINKIRNILKSNKTLKSNEIFEELSSNNKACISLYRQIKDSYEIGPKGFLKKISSMFYNLFLFGEFKSSADLINDCAKKMMSLQLSLEIEEARLK